MNCTACHYPLEMKPPFNCTRPYAHGKPVETVQWWEPDQRKPCESCKRLADKGETQAGLLAESRSQVQRLQHQLNKIRALLDQADRLYEECYTGMASHVWTRDLRAILEETKGTE